MRALLICLAAAVFGVAPAGACTVYPMPKHMYWQSAPETLGPDEVALQVMFVRHPAKEELLPKDPDSPDVIVTSCGEPAHYTYRVLRVLGGDYKGPIEFNTSVLGGIAENPKKDEIQIVVGKLRTADNWPPFFLMRSPPR